MSDARMGPTIVSVNVGRPRTIGDGRDAVRTAIWKTPIEGAVQVAPLNLDGDEQADLEVHGGPYKAVYAYAIEDYAWWSARLGIDLAPATFGENLTLKHVDVSGARIGERWRIGESLLLQVAQPRFPCYKLGLRMNDNSFPKIFSQALRFGAYFRVIDPGPVKRGDAIRVMTSPPHGWTIRDVGRTYLFDRSKWAELAGVPDLPPALTAALRRKSSAPRGQPAESSGGDRN